MAQPAPRPASGTDDWAVEAADRIEAVVEVVRDKTAVPAQKAATAVVYGLVAGVMGILALVLFVIGVLRLHVYLPFQPEGRKVWVTYLGIGAIFVVAGALLWRRRTPSRRPSDKR